MRRTRAVSPSLKAWRLVGLALVAAFVAAPAAHAAAPTRSLDANPLVICSYSGDISLRLFMNFGLTGSVSSFVVPGDGDAVALELSTGFDTGLGGEFPSDVDRVAGTVTSLRLKSDQTQPSSTELIGAPLPFGPMPLGNTFGSPIVVHPPAAQLDVPDDLSATVQLDLEQVTFSAVATSSTDPSVQKHVSVVCEPAENYSSVASVPVATGTDGGVGISQISPSTGRSGGGTTVTITGPGIGEATAVSFGPNPAASFKRVSATELTAVSPAGTPGNAQVKVITPAGSSPDTPVDDFTYTRPTLSTLGPNYGSSKGGTFVYVQGTGLDDVNSVTVGTQTMPFYLNSTQQGHFSTPPGTGTVPVVLNSPVGSTPITDDTVFMYNSATVSPQSGDSEGGTRVTISGIDASHATGVTFNGRPGLDFAKLGSSSVQVTTPPLGGPSVVLVQFDNRESQPVGDPFGAIIYEHSPWIQSISPASGPVTGGTEVTITGGDLTYSGTVFFGRQQATVLSRAKTQLKVIAPPGSAGKVDISITGGFNGVTQNTPADDFTYLADPVEPAIPYAFGVTGRATLKTLAKGAVSLSGQAVLRVSHGTTVVGDGLTLKPTVARLVAGGFLPVAAKLTFVSDGPLTGTFAAGSLSFTAKVRIKLPSITVAGIQLAGGASCQTKTASSLELNSTAPWASVGSGGSLAGSFAISDLTGCGSLTSTVSPLTAGKGNAIALKLTP